MHMGRAISTKAAEYGRSQMVRLLSARKVFRRIWRFSIRISQNLSTRLSSHRSKIAVIELNTAASRGCEAKAPEIQMDVYLS